MITRCSEDGRGARSGDAREQSKTACCGSDWLKYVSVYLQNCTCDISLSESFFMTLATAISKSSCVTCTLLSLSANIPASVHTAFDSAPDAPFIAFAIFLRLIPRIKFI